MTLFGNANGSILRWGDTPSFGLKQWLEKVPQAQGSQEVQKVNVLKPVIEALKGLTLKAFPVEDFQTRLKGVIFSAYENSVEE
jgi:hypothetical protein